jgi:hypothetical protein
MTEQAHSAIRGNGETRYATCQHFLKIFDEDMQGLYQLSFLLTGDHQKGEKCFVAGMEACAKENRVFREWARTWAKRVSLDQATPIRPRWRQLLSLRKKAQSDISTWTLCWGLQISSGLSLCSAFWSAIGSTSVLCFSAVQLPRFAKLALRLSRSWLTFGRVFSTCMEIAGGYGQKH